MLADPADILFNPGLGGIVGIPCASLGLIGCTGVAAPPYDDLDALSYGADFGQYLSAQGYVGFSVETGSVGLAGTAVNYEAATCATAEPEADEFATQLDGNNSRVYDGDGIDCVSGGPVPGMGLQEPNGDDLDALDGHDLYFVDWTPPDGVPDQEVYFSLDPVSPTLGANNWSAADILVTIGGAMPPTVGYATAAQLGLVAGDDVDGLCLAERGWTPPATPKGISTRRVVELQGLPVLHHHSVLAQHHRHCGPRPGARRGDNHVRAVVGNRHSRRPCRRPRPGGVDR